MSRPVVVLVLLLLGVTAVPACGGRTPLGDAAVARDLAADGPPDSGPDAVDACPVRPGCEPGIFNFQTEQDALACFAPCTSDSDCRDPCLPYCSIQGLVEGGDFNCNGQIQVCRSTRQDDCPAR
jgi:hypothetical protein